MVKSSILSGLDIRVKEASADVFTREGKLLKIIAVLKPVNRKRIQFSEGYVKVLVRFGVKLSLSLPG